MDEQQATTAKAVPERLAILGGGVVGVEMAQAWGSLGSRRDPHSPRPAPDPARRAVRERPGARVAARAGRRVRTGRPRRRGSRSGASASSSTTALPSRPTSCSSPSVARRAPRGLASRHSGSRPASRSRSATTCACAGHDWMYAVGDVNGRVQLTHMGKYQGRLAADTILGRKRPAALATAGARRA